MTSQTLTNGSLTQIYNEINAQLNLNNYSNASIGTYITTTLGDFCLVAKPNIYQPISSRTWDFVQTSDSEGEPMTNGETIRIQL